MINIEVTKKFRKQVFELQKKRRKQLFDRLRIFCLDPYDQTLKTHPLKGNLSGIHSFSVTGDLRVHFKWEDKEKTEVLILQIGTHSQLY
jgi:addiction module RelE/StbE family toxin